MTKQRWAICQSTSRTQTTSIFKKSSCYQIVLSRQKIKCALIKIDCVNSTGDDILFDTITYHELKRAFGNFENVQGSELNEIERAPRCGKRALREKSALWDASDFQIDLVVYTEITFALFPLSLCIYIYIYLPFFLYISLFGLPTSRFLPFPPIFISLSLSNYHSLYLIFSSLSHVPKYTYQHNNVHYAGMQFFFFALFKQLLINLDFGSLFFF